MNKEIKQFTWTYTADSADIISLHIKLSNRQLHIHNIYNPINIKKISKSILILKKKLAKKLHKKYIPFGSFNLYHELWGRPDASKTYIKKSEKLLIAMQR